MMNLVLMETSGNQNYIFATNKLRENVGASELTYQAGKMLVRAAIKHIIDRDVPKDLMNEKAIDDAASNGVEVIIATSGKALLLTNSPEIAEKIVAHVTTAALQTMPGLTIHGAIVALPDLTHIHQAVGDVHRKLEEIRSRIPSNAQRFLRLPWMASCATSGFPAQRVKSYEPKEKPYSDVAVAKADHKVAGQKRIQDLLPGLRLIDPLDIENSDWTAIIHADGNGLGQIFLSFDQYAGFDDQNNWSPRQYVKDYRAFSLELDRCVINATKTALEHLWNSLLHQKAKEEKTTIDQLSPEIRAKIELPVVPLVLGGDDLTALCDGRFALKFTVDFLRAFEAETLNKPTISKIAEKAFGQKKLGICAGIAIVKPHYPFHQAYELAEQLLKSAKQVKDKIKHHHKGKDVSTPTSAFDFHILYDSKSSELSELRENITIGESVLTAKPYIVSALENPAQNSWEEKRQFSALCTRIEAMRASDKEDPSKRALPNSQLHSLREALFFGYVEANAQMQLIRERYKDNGFEELLCGESLFFPYKEKHYTHFMDALDAVEFWRGFEDNAHKKGVQAS